MKKNTESEDGLTDILHKRIVAHEMRNFVIKLRTNYRSHVQRHMQREKGDQEKTGKRHRDLPADRRLYKTGSDHGCLIEVNRSGYRKKQYPENDFAYCADGKAMRTSTTAPYWMTGQPFAISTASS